MEQGLINLVLALIANGLLQNVVEMLDKRDRLMSLRKLLSRRKREPIDMSTIQIPHRTNLLSIIGFMSFVVIFFGFFSLLDLKGEAALWMAITLLAVNFILTTLLSGRVHSEIEHLTKQLPDI